MFRQRHRRRRPVWNPSALSESLQFVRSVALGVPDSIDTTWRALGSLARILVIALSLGAVIYSYRELTRHTLIVEPIGVPKQYAEAGITPEVMANRIRDGLTDIEAKK